MNPSSQPAKGRKFADRAAYVAAIRAESRFNFTCVQCGVSFYRNLGGAGVARLEAGKPPRFCSKACEIENEQLNRRTPFCTYIAGPCRTCGEPTSKRQVVPLECPRCLRERQLREGREKGLLREAQEHRENAPVRTCVACGTLFSNLPRRDWYSACSVECDRRRHRARKKAQKIKREDAEKDHKRRIKVVDPIKVFERDGWRCRLCGVPTPLELRNKNLPNSPELDHVVPLSRQGEHSYENTQLLCRRCNLDKADLLLHEM